MLSVTFERDAMIYRSIFVLLAVSNFIAVANAQYAPQVGAPHPDFRLPRISDRKAVSLSDYRGKKILLVQFASW